MDVARTKLGVHIQIPLVQKLNDGNVPKRYDPEASTMEAP